MITAIEIGDIEFRGGRGAAAEYRVVKGCLMDEMSFVQRPEVVQYLGEEHCRQRKGQV